MEKSHDRAFAAGWPLRRCALAMGLAVSLTTSVAHAQSVDLSKWSTEYIRSIAGTEEVDTAAECSKVVPLDYKGRVSVWWTGSVRRRVSRQRCSSATRWWKPALRALRCRRTGYTFPRVRQRTRFASH